MKPVFSRAYGAFTRRRVAQLIVLIVLTFSATVTVPSPIWHKPDPAKAALGTFIYTACRQGGLYKASISGGSSALVVDPGTPIFLHATDSYLYFTGDGKVQRSTLAGESVTTLVTGTGDYAANLYGIDVDSTYLYYGNTYNRTIGRALLDGTSNNQSFVNMSAISGLYGHDVAVSSSHIYFGGGNNSVSRNIGRANIDGTSPALIITDSDGAVTSLAIDRTYIYWTDTNGEIGRAKLDGSSMNDNFIRGLFDPWGIEVTSTYIYVAHTTSSYVDKIGRASIDGSGLSTTWSANGSGCNRGLSIAGAYADTADTTAPTVSSFSSTTSNGSYKAAATINITATTNEAIQSGNTLTVTLDTGRTVILTAASAGTSLTGTYTVQAGDTSSDLTVSTFTIGTVADTAGNAMTSTTVPTGSSNIAGASAIIIDTTAPTVSSLSFTSSAGADNTYITADTVSITVVFSQAVTITGSPRIPVAGLSSKYATYASGTGTTSIVFSYTVASGDTDADGVAVSTSTLELNSGTIADAAGNNATITHSAITASASHLVDTTAPTASATTATIANTANATVQSTETGTAYLVRSSITVSNLLSITGASATSWNSVTITSANTDTSLAATGLIDGSYLTYAVDAGGNLSAASSNTVTIDTTAPTVTLAASAATSTSATITFTVTGNEAITCSTLSTNSGTHFTYTNILALTGIVQTSSTVCTVTATSTALADGVAVVSTLTAAGSFSMTDTAGNAQTTLTGSPQTTTVTIAAVTTTTAVPVPTTTTAAPATTVTTTTIAATTTSTTTTSTTTTSTTTTSTTTTSTTTTSTTTTSTTTTVPTSTTVPDGQVGMNSWSMVASPNPVKVGQQFVLTTTISCGRQMSTSVAPYYPRMYYLVNSSPWLNGVYGRPSLSGDRRTATFSVTLTAPATKGVFNMYAYGRDNPTGGTCTGNSYNFSNSPTTRLTVDATPTVTTLAPLINMTLAPLISTTVAPTVTTVAPTSLLEGSAGIARAPGTGGVVVDGRVTDLAVTFDNNNSASIKYLNNLIVKIAGNSPAAARSVATGSSSIRVYRNQTVEITGSGYAPNTSVDVWINSTPIKLGSTMSDANGLVSEIFGISGNIDIGNHTITLNGKFADGTKASVSVGIEVVDTPTVTTVAPTVTTVAPSVVGLGTLAPLTSTTLESQVINKLQLERPVSISTDILKVTIPSAAIQNLFDSVSPEDINTSFVKIRTNDGKWKTVRATSVIDANIDLTPRSQRIEIQLIVEGKDPITYEIVLDRVASSSSQSPNFAMSIALGLSVLLIAMYFSKVIQKRRDEE